MLLTLAACGAPQSQATRDGGTCDGSRPARCDGTPNGVGCIWRCVDGQWVTDSPCQSCVCLDRWCSRFGP